MEERQRQLPRPQTTNCVWASATRYVLAGSRPGSAQPYSMTSPRSKPLPSALMTRNRRAKEAQPKTSPPTPYVVSVQPAGNKPVRRSRAESKAKRLVTKWQQHKAEPPQPNGARSETNEDASTSKLECSVARYVEQDLTGNTQADPTVPK